MKPLFLVSAVHEAVQHRTHTKRRRGKERREKVVGWLESEKATQQRLADADSDACLVSLLEDKKKTGTPTLAESASPSKKERQQRVDSSSHYCCCFRCNTKKKVSGTDIELRKYKHSYVHEATESQSHKGTLSKGKTKEKKKGKRNGKRGCRRELRRWEVRRSLMRTRSSTRNKETWTASTRAPAPVQI